MSPSFDLDAPELFTAGAVGPPGRRVFYLQGRQGATLVTLRCEKEHVRALGRYLAEVLAHHPEVRPDPVEAALAEPLVPAWLVGTLGAGEEGERIVVVAGEYREDGAEEEPATARFRITRAQAAAFVERAEALMRAGRPLCRVCGLARDPSGHVCPRSNGHGPGG